jgi:hypothetical protein
VIAAALVAAVAGRVALGAWHAADLVVAVIGVAGTGPVEWVVHRYLFHAPADSRRARWLAAGRSHRRHHLDPPDLRWLRLAPPAAAAMLAVVAGLVAALAVPIALVTAAPAAGPYLSAVAVAWLAVAHYEWTHLLIHSSYRARSGLYRRLARNHRLHHYRNEAYWLGVTSELGDRLLGTRPAAASGVALSPTARTLS